MRRQGQSDVVKETEQEGSAEAMNERGEIRDLEDGEDPVQGEILISQEKRS